MSASPVAFTYSRVPNLTTAEGIMSVATAFELELVTGVNSIHVVSRDQRRELQALAEMLIDAGVKFTYVNNTSIRVHAPIECVQTKEAAKVIEATKTLLVFCQVKFTNFTIHYNGGLAGMSIIFDQDPVQASPAQPTPTQPSKLRLAEIVDMARTFGLGTMETSRQDANRPYTLLIQKVWTNPKQVEGFRAMLLSLQELKIEHTVDKGGMDDNCCYICVPLQQANLIRN